MTDLDEALICHHVAATVPNDAAEGHLLDPIRRIAITGELP